MIVFDINTLIFKEKVLSNKTISVLIRPSLPLSEVIVLTCSLIGVKSSIVAFDFFWALFLSIRSILSSPVLRDNHLLVVLIDNRIGFPTSNPRARINNGGALMD